MMPTEDQKLSCMHNIPCKAYFFYLYCQSLDYQFLVKYHFFVKTFRLPINVIHIFALYSLLIKK